MVDSITITESDELYLARPGGLAVADNGDFYVVDYFANHFVRFDRSGEPVRVYGGFGHGPGEFGSMGQGLIIFDTIVGALDYSPRGFHFFERESGRYLGTRRIAGTPTAAKVVDGTAWIGNIDLERGQGVAVWDLEADPPRSGEGADEELRSGFAALPQEYIESEMLRGTWGIVHTSAWDDTVLVGFAGSPFLLEYTHDGVLRDTIFLPARRRKGVPPDFADRLEQGREHYSEKFAMASALFGLSRAGNGDLIVVHFDSELDPANRIDSRVYVSVLSADLRRVCVDREIPTSSASQPVVTLRGDTLYVLEQHLSESEVGEAVTTLKSYRIDATDCEWLPTGSAELTYRG